MYMDGSVKVRQKDMVVVCVCDGFDKIPQSFLDYATKNQFFDINVLKEKGFLKEGRDGKWEMKEMDDLMDKNAKNVPKNILHLFQVCTWDFGLDTDTLKGRRINFIFALK